MKKDSVDRKHLRITGRHKAVVEPNVAVVDTHATHADPNGVIIVVTQAFGPDGDNLVGISDVTFDGYPAVTLRVRTGGAGGDDSNEGLVHMSPIHGDNRKTGFTDIAVGTKCELICPMSGKSLPYLGHVEDGSGAGYYAIYLSRQLAAGSTVMVSDTWGHYHSRIIDAFELISHWAAEETE